MEIFWRQDGAQGSLWKDSASGADRLLKMKQNYAAGLRHIIPTAAFRTLVLLVGSGYREVADVLSKSS
jgi:hypothetical protein